MTYGKSAHISRQAAFQRNRNVVSISASRSGLGPVSNAIVLIVVMCLLGLVYLTQVTRTNALNYRVYELTAKQNELKEEYASLQVDSVRLQSMERVKNSPQAAALLDTKPSSYVR